MLVNNPTQNSTFLQTCCFRLINFCQKFFKLFLFNRRAHTMADRNQSRSELRDIVDNLRTAVGLDNKVPRILELLRQNGHSYLAEDHQLFHNMVWKSFFLIESTHYLKVIEKMADIQKRTGGEERCRSLCHLAICQVSNYYQHFVLIMNQDKLLAFSQIMLSICDTLESRTECLKYLLQNTQYHIWTKKKCSQLHWTENFISFSKQLMNKGVDLESLLKDGTAFSLSSTIIHIIANDQHLLPSFMELFQLFLTEMCLKHKESVSHENTGRSALHALVDCDWDRLKEDLPPTFVEQYRTIISQVISGNPALLDAADKNGRNPLLCLIHKVKECKEILIKIFDIVLILKSEANINAKDCNGSTALHYVIEVFPFNCLEETSEDSQEVWLNLVKSLHSPTNIDMQDKNECTPLNILARRLFHDSDLAYDICNFFQILTTPENVNCADCNAVTPYSWILRKKETMEKTGRSTEGIFSRIEEIFLQNCVDFEPANDGMHSIHLMELKEVTEKLETPIDIDYRKQRISDLLAEDGFSIIKQDPQVFVNFVKQANLLIGSDSYSDIIQKMAEIYQKVNIELKTESQEKANNLQRTGPLDSFIMLIDNQYVKNSILMYPDKFLSLLQILIKADDSTHSRTKCLWIVMKHARHTKWQRQRGLKGWQLEWSDAFINIVKLLLNVGADPTWSGENVKESALNNFFLSIIHILANESLHLETLMDLISAFLRGLSFEHHSSVGTALHALVSCERDHWVGLNQNLPHEFYDQYKTLIQKTVKENPAQINMTSCGLQTPLHHFILSLKECRDMFRIAQDVIQILKSDSNINIEASGRCTVLYYLASAFPFNQPTKSNITFLQLAIQLVSISNVDIQNQDGHTILHVLSRKVYLNPALGSDLLLAFYFLTTEHNVNALDRDSVTPYSWIMAGRLDAQRSRSSTAEMFVQIEKTFIRKGADVNLAIGGIHVVRSLELIKLVNNLQTPADLDRCKQRILDLVIREDVIRTNIAPYKDFIIKYDQLKESASYLDVRREMTAKYNQLGMGDVFGSFLEPTYYMMPANQTPVHASYSSEFADDEFVITPDIGIMNGNQYREMYGQIDQNSRLEEMEQKVTSCNGDAADLFLWLNEEISSQHCKLSRLQKMLKSMKTVTNWYTGSFFEEIRTEVFRSLQNICHPKFMDTIKEIVKILVKNEYQACQMWDGILSNLQDKKIEMFSLEILSLCAENGALPSKEDLKKLLSHKRAVTATKEMTVAYLKTLLSIQMHTSECDMDFLADCYIVDREVQNLGKEIVHQAYKTLLDCLTSKKLINCFLFMSSYKVLSSLERNSSSVRTALHENLMKSPMPSNWLRRSPLHLAAIFLDDEFSLNCLPETFVAKYLNALDLNGCTPLHIAYLHHNKEAVKFLTMHGAKSDVIDQYGIVPRETSTQSYVEDEYHQLCCKVIEAESGVLEHLRPMLVISEDEADALGKQLIELFGRMMKQTKFSQAVIEIAMAGSMREKLKAGQLDEADVQIRFNKFICEKQDEFRLKKDLENCLTRSMDEISWDGISLRPICNKGPWKFIHEFGSNQGMTMNVDVVPILTNTNNTEGNSLARDRLEQIVENVPLHKSMLFSLLDTTNKKFTDTPFLYEWSLLDSLPLSCRLAIIIAKALVQAYEKWEGNILGVKLPITSYMIKTVMFYILKDPGNVISSSGSFENMQENEAIAKIRNRKLKLNPDPKWMTDNDIEQNAEEARLLAGQIFTVIAHFAKSKKKLPNYWQELYVAKSKFYNQSAVGETEYILDICDCLLERLCKTSFY